MVLVSHIKLILGVRVHFYRSIHVNISLIMSMTFTGIELLGPGNTDINQAISLTLRNDIVDIYSNSWGPSDYGDVVSGPGTVASLALHYGIHEVCCINTLVSLLYAMNYRDVVEKDPYLCGLMAMVALLMIVQLMDMLPVFIQSQLGLLV